jgi:hypothetical protein
MAGDIVTGWKRRNNENQIIKKRKNIKIEETDKMAGTACSTWSYSRI